MVLTKKVEEKSGLDLEALSAIDEQIVDVSGQTVTMTSLVPADIEKARKLVLSKQLSEEMVMEYLTFLSMRKKHPEVSWYKFMQLNFKTINKLMAVMAVQNGFDETFQVFREPGAVGGSDPGEIGDSVGVSLD